MKYARGFLALQLRFAETVAEPAGLSLERALLDYTNLYIRFGIGRDFDPAHPRWQGYLAGLRAADSPAEWTYQFYLACPPAPPAPGLVATFGCFAYAHLPDGRVRLHFRNAEPPARSPLGPERRPLFMKLGYECSVGALELDVEGIGALGGACGGFEFSGLFNGNLGARLEDERQSRNK